MLEYKEKFPLTSVALAYLTGRDAKTELGGNATGFYAEFQGNCEAQRLEMAINRVIARQPMLRTLLFSDGTQAELTKIPVYQLPVTDLQNYTCEEIEAFFQKLRAEESHRIFQLESWPMFNFSFYLLPGGKSRVVISFDMMLMDRFSIEILVRELNAFYREERGPLKPLPHSYQDYVNLVEDERRDNGEGDRKFWEQRIPHMPPAPPIAMKREGNSGGRFTSRVKVYGREQYQSLQERLYDNHILPSVYMLYCYGKCLSRFSSANDMSVSMTIAHRAPMGHVFSDLIGDFTKLLLVDLHWDAEENWIDGCRALHRRIKEYMKHTAFDGLDVMKEFAREHQLSGKAVFPFAFTSSLASQDESHWHFLGDVVYQISRTPQLAVDCQISEHRGQLEIRWDCLKGILSDQFLDSMFWHYVDLVEKTIDGQDSHAGIDIDRIALYNKTAEDIPSRTLQTLFENQAAKTPSNPALSVDGETYTYGWLRDASDRVASALYEKYGTGGAIMVDGQRTAETIVAILGILKSGNAYVPYDGEYPEKRIQSIKESCHASALITPAVCRDMMAQGAPPFSAILGNPEDTAYIIFTSGSTGIPKGVVITQDAVCNTILDVNHRFGLQETDCILGISSFWFDLSVYDIFGAFSTGAHDVVSQKVEMEHIVNLMNRYPVTFWNTVPAILDLLVSSDPVLPRDILKNVLLSGDWIPLELPQKIHSLFPKAKVCSLGGATEASIWSIYYPIEKVEQNWNSIPYGYPLANQTIYVLDEAGRLCPTGVQGEICIGGRGVAKEYCANEAETQAHFVDHPQYGRIYRTGDYGLMSEEGYVIFHGRMDQQIKLHGFRIELGEIESALLKCDAVDKAISLIRESASGASVIVAYVICRDREVFDEASLRRAISESIPHYMLPSAILCVDEFPLTSNGKIDRKALPLPDIAESKKDLPRTQMESKIAEIWEKEMGATAVYREDNFFYLGGDSLMGIRVAGQIQKELKIKVDVSEIFASPVLKEFCEGLERKRISGDGGEEGLPAIVVDSENENRPFPLTDVQRSYWIGAKGMMSLSGVTTHAVCELICEDIEFERLEMAFNKVIAEQGMMRAVVLRDGSQQILEKVPHYPISILEADEDTVEEMRQNIRSEIENERFNPEIWPLFKVQAIRCRDTVFLYVDLDNLIFDGFSVQLLFSRWSEYYHNSAKNVEKLGVSFRDYVNALAAVKQSAQYEIDQQYWKQQVLTMAPAPDLFTISSPDMLVAQTISHYTAKLDPQTWQQLQANSRAYGLTPATALLTAYSVLLSLWSRTSAFTINVTQYNRLFNHPEINALIGDFTLLSMLSVDMSAPATFCEHAQRIQNKVSDNMAHPYFSGVEVQQEYAKLHQLGGVIFPIVFTCTVGMASGRSTERGLGKVERITTETPQVWLDCQVTELEGGLNISLEAVKELFPAETPAAMMEFYRKLLLVLSEDRQIWKSSLQDILYPHNLIPTLRERERLSELAPVDRGSTLESLFVSQALRAPERIAVIDRTRTMTYGQLYREALLLSEEIAGKNQSIVAILLKKGWRQVVAVVATLMSGAAYLPLDMGNPDKRIEEILDKSQANLILTEADLAQRASGFGCDFIVISGKPMDTQLKEHPLQCTGDSLAYCIFTSGSTGKPKGVMISHRGAVNTILDVNERFHIDHNDRTLALSALNFDLSVYDIFGMLACGGAVVIPGEWDRKDPHALMELIHIYGVTVWNSVPAFMQMLAEYALEVKETAENLRVVMLSGDWIPLDLTAKIRRLSQQADIYSLGGATEASIWSNYYPIREVKPEWRSIPYGYPLSGQGFRILNDQMLDCPPNTIGKLYIFGTGVALGYLHDRALTGERFIEYGRTGERLYDTGDLGMYWNDGTIEFWGREDFQVKIRGHRIELGEIEAAVNQSHLVKEAAAMAVKVKGKPSLAAAIVPIDGSYPEEEILADALGEAQKRLP